MLTEEALDFIYDNPGTCISTEALYEEGKYYYYDKDERLVNADREFITEDNIQKDLKKIYGKIDPETFNEWMEIDVTIEGDDYDESLEKYMYGDDMEDFE